MIAAPLIGLLGLFIAALPATAQTNPFTACIQTYTLKMPPATWAQLQLDARDEDWERAQVSIDGAPIAGDVGLRFKGSTGSLKNCFVNDVWDKVKCPRLSLKIKFTKYDGEPYIGGIETLNFHSMVNDKSKMAEKISYKLFNDVGVKTSRTSWAKLTMNGDDLGLFALVDQLDEVFAKRIDGTGKGQLYKEAWIEDRGSDYFEENLKEGSSDHSPILAFQDALTSAPDGCRLQILASAFDTANLYNYMAVDAAIGNWDGVTGFYCNGETGGCGNHNFYIYRTQENGYTLIPWDHDNTMNSNRLFFDDVPFWLNPGSCDARYPLFGGTSLYAETAGCSPMFKALAENPAAFSFALESLLATGFASLESEIETYRTLLAPHIDAAELSSWNDAVDSLKAGLPALRARARAYKSPAAPAVCGAGTGPTTTTPTSQSTADCCAPGVRNQGAPGYPAVQYKRCCDGQSSTTKAGDWGKFCPGGAGSSTQDQSHRYTESSSWRSSHRSRYH